VWASVRQNQAERELRAKSEEIAELNRQIAGSVTGGNSFGRLVVTRPVAGDSATVVFSNEGRFPLYEVEARIANLDKFDSPQQTDSLQDFLAGDTMLRIGTVPPNAVSLLDERLPLTSEHVRFNIFFSARNGFWTQQLRLRRIDGEWYVASEVSKTEDDSTRTSLHEDVSPDYPRNEEGKVEW